MKRKSAYPAQRNANSALKIATKRTKSKLAPQAKTKTVTTYPKGLYRRTLRAELCKANAEVGLGDGCKTKSAAKPKAKKRVSRATKPIAAKPVKRAKATAPKKKSAPKKKKGFLSKIFG